VKAQDHTPIVVEEVCAADAIYTNAVLITMDPSRPPSETGAVAVKNGRIMAVGEAGEIARLAAARTEIVDLGGKTLLPGFYDPHGHFPNSGVRNAHFVNLNSPPMGPVERIEDLVEALRRKAAELPEGSWVLGHGYDDTLMAEGRHPTRRDLERASEEHPVWIQHTSGHLGVANGRALEAAGIAAGTAKPEGGVIRIDPGTGEPDGVLEETAMDIVKDAVPPFSRTDWLTGLDRAVREFAARGVTTAVIAGCDRDTLLRLQRGLAGGRLPLRLVCMTRRDVPEIPSPGEAAGLMTGFGGERMRLGAVKIWQDGSIQGYTGYLSSGYHVPYQGDTSYVGYPLRSREALCRMVADAHRDGNQVAIHGNGDAAIDDILHAYAEAQKRHPRQDARHRIEHCQMAREDQLDRMAEMGVTPSFFVAHTFYWGDRHARIFMGPERAARMSPLASASRRGTRFTLHNDSPVTTIDPLFSVWAAVNRRSRSGRTIGEDQRIGPLEALRAVTIDAAWQNFEEADKGSIEPGKLADLVALEENPLKVDPLAIKDIAVLRTVVGGRTVYRAEG